MAGAATPVIEKRGRQFYVSVTELFERWVTRRPSHHTQQAYRQDVMSLVDFLAIP